MRRGFKPHFLIVFLLHFYNRWMQLENMNRTKKKDHENRTRIGRMVPIYVLDFGPKLANMVVCNTRALQASRNPSVTSDMSDEI